ncbi:hypothetical protein HU200_037148 [Digitaria exilis]|uniref:Pectinesterase inhibitor domain-containing protein n=1 Tax=Digitaria exilis TaxID=1010633 RepID=A0A835EN78_9POAL|nr:hypothetical protein HU200_037148 [Digitaria exilis]
MPAKLNAHVCADRDNQDVNRLSSTLVAVLLCAAAFLVTDATSGRLLKASSDDPVASACAPLRRTWAHRCVLRRSAAAKHPQDLALVAMDLVQMAGAEAGAKVGGALSPGGLAKLSNDTALTLRYCKLDYEALARTVSVCRSMVQGYSPDVRGHHDDGQILLPYTYLECADRLMNAARDCWDHIFHDNEIKEVVWKEVNEVAGRANLAKAMVEQMLGIVDDEDNSHSRPKRAGGIIPLQTSSAPSPIHDVATLRGPYHRALPCVTPRGLESDVGGHELCRRLLRRLSWSKERAPLQGSGCHWELRRH